MERCRTCKHFKFPHRDGPAHLGECTRWHVGYQVNVSDVAPNEALVEDDGPDFGCVLHEPA